MNNSLRVFVPLLFLFIVANIALAASDSFATDPTERAARRMALNQNRRLLWNDDGGGSVGLTHDNVKKFLSHRLDYLVGSEVNTILYCTKSSGFGIFTHFTKVGYLMPHDFKSAKSGTLDPAHLENYIDPLKLVVDWGHRHQMEVFWSMRMNDTHDGGNGDAGASMFATNPFKTGHPDWLLGTADHHPVYGKWTAVDYERPEIRDLAFRFFQEVCQNYDVDGIELDFFRHPTFFHYPGPDQPVTQAQRDLMTGLVEHIRTMVDAEGKKRGRPILIAMRVPDSVDYCRAVGIDLEKWLGEDLCDMLVPSSYIRMNPWSYTVALGHRYGVKVYPSFDEPRNHDDKNKKPVDSSQGFRVSNEGYRGRALQAWAEGADGVYLYNFFKGGVVDPPNQVLKEIGDAQDLMKLDRTYFASYLGLGRIAGGGYPHRPFQAIETLNPNDPKPVAPGRTVVSTLNVPDDFAKEKKSTLTLKFRFAPPQSSDNLTATVNGRKLSDGKADGDWIDFACTPEYLRQGDNKVAVTLAKNVSGSADWQDLALMVKAGAP